MVAGQSFPVAANGVAMVGSLDCEREREREQKREREKRGGRKGCTVV
jgi:hypothetical protein